jgi:hypothetical protein
MWVGLTVCAVVAAVLGIAGWVKGGRKAALLARVDKDRSVALVDTTREADGLRDEVGVLRAESLLAAQEFARVSTELEASDTHAGNLEEDVHRQVELNRQERALTLDRESKLGVARTLVAKLEADIDQEKSVSAALRDKKNGIQQELDDALVAEVERAATLRLSDRRVAELVAQIEENGRDTVILVRERRDVQARYDALVEQHEHLIENGGTLLWDGECDSTEAAAILGIGESTVRAWRGKGKITFRPTKTLLSSNSYGYDRAALVDLALDMGCRVDEERGEAGLDS